MNEIDKDTSRKIIEHFDKILELSGSSDRLSSILDTFTKKIDVIVEEEKDDKVAELMKKHRESVQQKVLEDVIVAVGRIISLTVTQSTSTMDGISKDKQAVKAAMDAWMKEKLGDGK